MLSGQHCGLGILETRHSPPEEGQGEERRWCGSKREAKAGPQGRRTVYSELQGRHPIAEAPS